MNTKTLLMLGALGLGGYLIYRWWQAQQSALPASLQSTIDSGAYNAQALRLGMPFASLRSPNQSLDEALVAQGGTPGIL